MNEPTTLDLAKNRSDLAKARSHLANERTHLAYIRTGIALISFGVTLNRFSLYLIQNDKLTSYKSVPFLHDTKKVGVGMVILGSFLLIWSIIKFLRTARNINYLTFKPAKWSIVVFTTFITIFAVASTLWMLVH
jgi:putative membrane protein